MGDVAQPMLRHSPKIDVSGARKRNTFGLLPVSGLARDDPTDVVAVIARQIE